MTILANGGTDGAYSIVLTVTGTLSGSPATDTSSASSITLGSCPATSTFGVATLDSTNSISDCTGKIILKGTKVTTTPAYIWITLKKGETAKYNVFSVADLNATDLGTTNMEYTVIGFVSGTDGSAAAYDLYASSK